MGQVSVTLNGRTYRLSCGDGEEQHLLGLVAHVRGRMDQLLREHGQVGDDRLFLMTSLLIADELHDARKSSTSGGAVTSSDPLRANAVPQPAPTGEPRLPLPATSVSKPSPPSATDEIRPSSNPAPMPRVIEQMDATALMKGLERKIGRG